MTGELVERRFKTTSNYRNTPTGLASPDAALQPAHKLLRAQSRDLQENHDLYVSLIEDLVNNIAGDDLTVVPMPTSANGRELKTFKKVITPLWEALQDRIDSSGELPWGEFIRQTCRMWLNDGEVFMRHHMFTDYPYLTEIPYVVELIEADFCPIESLLVSQRAPQGIVKDQYGRPSQYLFFKTHPGELHLSNALANLQDLRAVDAAQITHAKFVRRWPQTRGQPIAHAVFNRLRDLYEYEGYELAAAKVAATLAAFIQRDLNSNRGGDDGIKGSDSTPTMTGLGAQIFKLQPGETVASIAANRPNPELGNFMGEQIKRITGAVGASYSSVSNDYDGSYSSQRQELVSAQLRYGPLKNYFYEKVVGEIYRRFVRAAVLSGAVELPTSANLKSLTKIEITGPGTAWIDPLKEVQADAKAVEEGFTSRYAVIKKRGGDPAVVDAEREADEFEKPASPMQQSLPLDEGATDEDNPPEDNPGNNLRAVP